MAPTLNFFAGINQISNLNGSGLGGFGPGGWGASIPVGAWQSHTFITNAAGTTQGPEGNNVQYLNAQSGILGQTGSGINLVNMPNAQGSLQIQFLNSTAVQLANNQLWIYDYVNINNPPSGMTVAVAELIHPSPIQQPGGSGSTTWQFPVGSGYLQLSQSPGVSGNYANPLSTYASTEHDFYVALSLSPTQIGGKTGGLYFYGEYH